MRRLHDVRIERVLRIEKNNFVVPRGKSSEPDSSVIGPHAFPRKSHWTRRDNSCAASSTTHLSYGTIPYPSLSTREAKELP